MAEEPEEGVQAESPTAPESAAPADAAAVTGSAATQDTDPEGVPWRNRMAEQQRRFDQEREAMRQQFQAQLQQYGQQIVQQFQSQAPRPQAAQEREYTEEELLQLANQGHSTAMQQLIQRQVRQQMAQQNQQQARASTFNQLVGQLQRSYPDFMNSESTLYRTANRFYAAFLPGRDPLEAQYISYTSAITELGLSQAPQRAAEGSRQASVQAHDAMGGTSFAAQSQRPQRGDKGFAGQVTPQEHALAKKLQVKNPQEAKKRFLERQAKGFSSVSPGLSSAIGDV